MGDDRVLQGMVGPHELWDELSPLEYLPGTWELVSARVGEERGAAPGHGPIPRHPLTKVDLIFDRDGIEMDGRW